MIQRLLAASLLAGLCAGLAIAALQHVTTTPLIIAAEVYEKAGGGSAALGVPASPVRVADASGHDHGAAASSAVPSAHEHDAGDWEPADGLERTAVTTLATVTTSVGYALLLAAAMVLAGEPITVRSGVAWGAAAFAATGLATGMGLAPELPASAAAALEARQLWWIATAAASVAGLWLLFKQGQPWAIGVGLALLAAPHVIGAPHPHAYGSSAPAELAARFAGASLGLHAIMWVTIGAALGLFWTRMAEKA